VDDDPYALYGEARGVVRILVEGDLPLALSQLLAHALRLLTLELAQPREQVLAALDAFLRARLEEYIVDHRLPAPIREAVLDRYADQPANAWRVAQVLTARWTSPELADMARAATRLANITRHGVDEEFTPACCTNPPSSIYTSAINNAPRKSRSWPARAASSSYRPPRHPHPGRRRLLRRHPHHGRRPLPPPNPPRLARRVLALYNALGNLALLGL